MLSLPLRVHHLSHLVLLAPDDLSVRACFVGGELAWAHPEERGAENGGRH